MGIKEFKEKLNSVNFATGAKKVALGIALAGALSLSLPQTAHAAVPASNILGDAQVGYSTRVEIKEQDAQAIHASFCQHDEYGNAIVDAESISHAIELSDALNGYYYDELYFTNTTKNEVLSLDVDGLYEQYDYAKFKGTTDSFCANNMGSKPAIDAYITFSCGTVTNGIKSELTESISRLFLDEGYQITSTPRLTINNNKLYAVIGLNKELRVIEITGEQVPEIISTILSLNNTYNVSLNNIAGRSNKYESSFAYNGVDKYTDESVWLSLPDDVKKSNLSRAVSIYESLTTTDGLFLEYTDPTTFYRPSDTERTMLESLGYTKSQIRNATVQEVTMTLLEKSYTK